VANNLTREETNEILLKVYSDNLEDTEKTKKISNIPKLLDKFDGKYDKLVEALYKKYPNVSKDDDSFNDYEPVEKRSPKKETPIFPDVMEESEELDEPDVMEESEELDEPDVMEESEESEELDEPDVMEESEELDEPDVMEESEELDEPDVMEESEELDEPDVMEESEELDEPDVMEESEELDEPDVMEESEELDEPDVMEESEELDEPDVMEESEELDEPDVMEESEELDEPDVMEESEELDEPDVMEESEESGEELSRSRVSVLMEESYRQNLENPDNKIAGIPKMLDKFEGRYEKLMEAMSKKYPLRDYSSEKNTQKSFEELINSISNNYQNRESWADLSKYFDSVGKLGRSLECSNHSKNL